MVEHDSIIPPGRVGTITPEVDIRGYHSGQMRKSVMVISDAENEPSLKLSLAVNIKAIIDLETNFVRLTFENGVSKPTEIKLSTEKADLQIKEVSFESRSSNGPMWQTRIPLPVEYRLARIETPKENGYYEYTLSLSATNPPNENRHGEFVIRTNHTGKDEIKVRGMIEVPSQN